MAPNLEKHPLHRGAYIAYDSEGFAFRVRKTAYGWQANPSHAGAQFDPRSFLYAKLRDVAAAVGASKRDPDRMRA